MNMFTNSAVNAIHVHYVHISYSIPCPMHLCFHLFGFFNFFLRMSAHNICFYGELQNIILIIIQYPLEKFQTRRTDKAGIWW